MDIVNGLETSLRAFAGDFPGAKIRLSWWRGGRPPT